MDDPAGADYNHEIISGINAPGVLLLIYSRHSVDSDPVKREVERARNRNLRVIPVRLENVPPSQSMEFLIAMSQWVDAFPPRRSTGIWKPSPPPCRGDAACGELMVP